MKRFLVFFIAFEIGEIAMSCDINKSIQDRICPLLGLFFAHPQPLETCYKTIPVYGCPDVTLLNLI